MNLILPALLCKKLRNVEVNMAEAGLVVLEGILAVIWVGDKFVAIIFSQHDVEKVVIRVLANNVLCQGVPTVSEPPQVIFVINTALVPEVTIKFEFKQVCQGSQVKVFEHVRRAFLPHLITHRCKFWNVLPKPAKAVNINGPVFMPFSKCVTLEVVPSDVEAILGVPSRHSLPLLGQEAVNSEVIRRYKSL